jgi:tryptophan-rich sensory protein
VSVPAALGASRASTWRMSAIAPPPIATEVDEAYEVRRESEAALAALRPHASAAEPSRRTAWLGSLVGLAIFGAASVAAAMVGGAITARRSNKAWYRMLRKPSFTPPDRLFALVWPVLYTLGTVSVWRVARTPASPTRSLALGLWGAQLACNAAWAPLFFGAHRPGLAMADLAGNYVSLGAYALTARKLDGTAAALVLPYVGWMTFAGVLNASIVGKNP